jgi:RNA polymerase sigma-70 factor (ECF subfamily)
LPFEEVAQVVGRPAATCRQLARRARQRIESDSARARFRLDDAEHRLVADRFIAACSSGDFDALVQVLAPEVSGEADFGMGKQAIHDHGAESVARNLMRFWGPGHVLVSLPVGDELALLAFWDRELRGLLTLTIPPGTAQVSKIHVTVDPVKLAFLRNLLPAGA